VQLAQGSACDSAKEKVSPRRFDKPNAFGDEHDESRYYPRIRVEAKRVNALQRNATVLDEGALLNRVSDHPTSESGMHIRTLEVRIAPYV
jgi:hypothetical protein